MSNFEITVNANGPLRVSGADIVIKDADGHPFDLGGRGVISLCRCGASSKKPFCDGAHKDIKFESTVKACALPLKKA